HIPIVIAWSPFSRPRLEPVDRTARLASAAATQNRDSHRWAVSCPRPRTGVARARSSGKVLLLCPPRPSAAVRTARGMLCVASAARSSGGRLAKTGAAFYAKGVRAHPLRAAELRRYDEAACLRCVHLHVGHLSGSRAFREGAL